MIRRLVGGLVAAQLMAAGLIVSGLGAAGSPAHAITTMSGQLRVTAVGAGGGGALRGFATPSPAPSTDPSPMSSPDFSSQPTPDATSSPAPQNQPAGPPGWLLILVGVAILIFTFSGGATRLAKRFQQPPPP